MEDQSWEETASIISELEGILARREEVRSLEEIQRLDEDCRRAVAERSEDARRIIQDLARAVNVDEGNVAPPSQEAHAEEMRALGTEKENIGAALQQMRAHIHEKEATLEHLKQELAGEDQTAQAAAQHHQRDAVPRVRHALSLYQNITHITWKYDTVDVAGLIAVPHRETVQEFSVAAGQSDFEIANELWDHVERACERVGA